MLPLLSDRRSPVDRLGAADRPTATNRRWPATGALAALVWLALSALQPGRLWAQDGEVPAPSGEHPYGWLSLAPPLLAVLLAIVTRRILASLLLGIFCGVLILQGGNLVAAVGVTLEGYLWQSLVKPDNMRVYVFTALMGAMIGVVHRSGGMHGLVARIAPLAGTRRRGQLATWALGLVVFFDDYANCLLLGNTMRPICDRLRISREKLAYLVDCTAAPVAGLALVSTWVATEIGYINEGYSGVGLGDNLGFGIFVSSIPYRFYPLLALAFVVLTAASTRDFGPMLAAERRAAEGLGFADEDGFVQEDPRLRHDPAQPRRWINAVAPIVAVLAVVLALIVWTGRNAALADRPVEAAAGGPTTAAGDDVASAEAGDVGENGSGVRQQATIDEAAASPVPSWREIFNSGDSYLALVYGAAAGLLTAVLLTRWQGIADWSQIGEAAWTGARLVVPAMLILWLASSLKDVTRGPAPGESIRAALDTASYVGEQLRFAPLWLLPTIVFLTASVVAFATGTSWGAMGILMPLSIGVAWRLLQQSQPEAPPDDPLMLAVVGSVLAGAIFGDHCSPISDTTVLSSAASGCNHFAHVWTQLPYALTVAAVCVVCGALPVALGVSPWLCLLAGLAALVLIMFGVGRKVSPEGADVAPLAQHD